MFAAKEKRLPVSLSAPGGRFIHGHAANGVNCHDDSPFPSAAPVDGVHDDMGLLRFEWRDAAREFDGLARLGKHGSEHRYQ